MTADEVLLNFLVGAAEASGSAEAREYGQEIHEHLKSVEHIRYAALLCVGLWVACMGMKR